MFYLLLFIAAALLALNIYASPVVLRSNRNDESQKKMQIAFVWLLPLFGAVVTTHMLNEGSRKVWDGGGRAEADVEHSAVYTHFGDSCAPGDGDGGD